MEIASNVCCPVSGETPEEERINHLTHLFGFILSIFGSILLLILASKHSDYWSILSCSIYSGSLILLYAASTYYHGCQVLHHKRIFQIIDHSCVYLLIAGSYTPIVLGPLRDFGGFNLFCIEWGIALVGIALKIAAIQRFHKLSLVAYLGMGWMIVFSFPTILEILPLSVLLLLLFGGLSYSIGVIFYLWDSFSYNHAIWHAFVLGGSICHYLAILFIVGNYMN